MQTDARTQKTPGLCLLCTQIATKFGPELGSDGHKTDKKMGWGVGVGSGNLSVCSTRTRPDDLGSPVGVGLTLGLPLLIVVVVVCYNYFVGCLFFFYL